MGTEIERKFLVTGEAWKTLAQPVLLMQGYLSSHPDRTVRVRVEGEGATLTIKGRSKGAVRGEWEYPIPLTEAIELLQTLCEKPLIEKRRYRISYAGMVWEVDEFLGENAGLIVAEIELHEEDQVFGRPDWTGEEVTHDPRYFNSSLLRHPYLQWQKP